MFYASFYLLNSSHQLDLLNSLNTPKIPPAIMPGTPKIPYPIATSNPVTPNFIFMSLVRNCCSAASVKSMFAVSMLSYIFYMLSYKTSMFYFCYSKSYFAWFIKSKLFYILFLIFQYYSIGIFSYCDFNYFYTIKRTIRFDFSYYEIYDSFNTYFD